MTKRLWIGLLWLALLWGNTQAQSTASWTILFYSNADNDLEIPIMGDFYEMQLAGSDDNINLVIQIDRAQGYDESNGDWTDTRRYYIEQRAPTPTPQTREEYIAAMAQPLGISLGIGRNEAERQLRELDDDILKNVYNYYGFGRVIDQTPLQRLGELNMGAEQTLYDFIVWGVRNYPAERYAVIISSHGGGWQGLGPDDANPPGMLDLPELSSAFGRARATLGIDKFDLIGFDACLMAQVEVAITIAPHAHYMLAAEEVVPGEGFAYEATLNALKQNPDWDAFQLGSAFIDTFIEDYAAKNRRQVDLHLIELANIPNVVSALETFYQASLVDTDQVLSALAAARINAQIFGSSASDNGEFRASIDLFDFARLVSIQTGVTQELFEAAQELQGSITSAVAYSRTDEFLPGAYGLAIYLPLTKSVYEAGGEGYAKQVPAEAVAWTQFLDNFHATAETVLADNPLSIAVTNVLTYSGIASYNDTPVIQLRSDGQGVVNMEVVVTWLLDSGEQLIVEVAPLTLQTILPSGDLLSEYPQGETFMDYTWLTEVPYVTDGENTIIAVINTSAGSTRFGLVHGRLIRGEDVLDASLAFDLTSRELERIVAQRPTENGSAPFETIAQPGDLFEPYIAYYDLEGNYTLSESGVFLDLSKTITYEYGIAPSGTYEVTLLLTDLLSNVALDRATVTVDNDNADPNFKGYLVPSWGFAVNYPSTWSQPTLIENEDGSFEYVTSSPDATASIYMTYYPEVTLDELVEAARARIINFGGEISDDSSTVSYDSGTFNLLIYTFGTEESLRYGVSAVFISAENGGGYLFDIDGDDQDNVFTIADAFLQTVRTFTPITSE
jgi:hypothetical protein